MGSAKGVYAMLQVQCTAQSVHRVAEGSVASEAKSLTMRQGRMICVTRGTVKEIALKFFFTLEILHEGEEILVSSLGFRTATHRPYVLEGDFIDSAYMFQEKQNYISCLCCDQCDLRILWAALVQNLDW